MAIVRFEPSSLLQQFQNEVNRLFENNNFLTTRDSSSAATTAWAPLVDIKEDKEAYLVQADIPGISPKDVEIQMDRNILTLKGSRYSETKDEKDNYVRMERSSGSFYRQFTLPDSVDSENIRANYNKGVLEIRIPKKEAVKAKKIEIEHREG